MFPTSTSFTTTCSTFTDFLVRLVGLVGLVQLAGLVGFTGLVGLIGLVGGTRQMHFIVATITTPTVGSTRRLIFSTYATVLTICLTSTALVKEFYKFAFITITLKRFIDDIIWNITRRGLRCTGVNCGT